MLISLIAAMASNRVIGNKNQLPRHYADDLRHFKEVTTGKVIVMGYNTYLSIGKALPNRRNIVLSSKDIDGVETYASIPALVDKLTAEGVSELFVIGGANVYSQFLPLADRIYLTQIKKAYLGDTYFPVFEDEFRLEGKEEHEEMDFLIYERE